MFNVCIICCSTTESSYGFNLDVGSGILLRAGGLNRSASRLSVRCCRVGWVCTHWAVWNSPETTVHPCFCRSSYRSRLGITSREKETNRNKSS